MRLRVCNALLVQMLWFPNGAGHVGVSVCVACHANSVSVAYLGL